MSTITPRFTSRLLQSPCNTHTHAYTRISSLTTLYSHPTRKHTTPCISINHRCSCLHTTPYTHQHPKQQHQQQHAYEHQHHRVDNDITHPADRNKSLTPTKIDSSIPTPTSTPTNPTSEVNINTKKDVPLGSPEGIPGVSMHPLTIHDIYAAHHRLKQYIKRSPLDYSTKLSKSSNCELYLKKEHLSMTGSYKERGALNKLLLLSDEEKRRGVICASAGNHAQAVSHHSTRMGIDGKICMPITTPHVKVQATQSFGGQVVLHGESFAEAFQHSIELAHKEGRTFVHAFNDSDVIAGQGTLAIELLEQNPFLEAIVVPIGGGGLSAGISLFIKHINPRIKVYGVETDAMPGMLRSVEAGHVVSVPKRPTFSDGIAIETVGLLPLTYIKQYVDEIVLVDEDELAAAVLSLMEIEKTICEGSGAAAVAAIMYNKLPQLHGKQVAAICTGGNIDMTLIGRIIDKGLFKSGRLARIHVTCLDVPGELCKVLSIIKDCRANVRDVMHEREFLTHSVGITQPSIILETRSFSHIEEVVNALQAHGFEDVFVDSPSSVPSPRRKSSINKIPVP